MNKFGIFNLLNSFFNLSNPTNDQNSQSNTTKDSSYQNVLNDLISSLNGKTNNEPLPKQADQPSQKHDVKAQPNTPLTLGMLSTIHAHDQHVKRVQNKSMQKK